MYLIEKRKLYSKVEKKKKIKKCQFFHPPSHLPLLSSPLACFFPLQIGQDSPSLRLLLFHPSPATCRCTHTLPATTHPSSTSHPLTPQSGSFFFCFTWYIADIPLAYREIWWEPLRRRVSCRLPPDTEIWALDTEISARFFRDLVKLQTLPNTKVVFV